MSENRNRPVRSAESYQSIGALLIQSGRITASDAERIIEVQKASGLRFGEVAIQLGLVKASDIDAVMARQFQYQYLQAGKSRVSQDIVAAYQPFTPVVENLRAIRTQLLLSWFRIDGDSAQRPLAVLSPTADVQSSLLLANLAVVFSQLGESTLLIDANLRTPRQHQLFGLAGTQGLSSLLMSGCAPEDVVERVPDLRDLSVLACGAVPPNPQELVERREFGALLQWATANYDVVLVDAPALRAAADALPVAARCGGCVLVAKQDLTSFEDLQWSVEQLRSTGSSVLGSVMLDVAAKPAGKKKSAPAKPATKTARAA